METRTGQAKPSDVVLECLHALEEKNYDRASQFFTNDFTFSGATPEPISGKEFIEVHRHLLQAIPDWRFNFNLVKEDPNEVTGKVHITGTQTRDLTLPMMPNVGTVHATGKKISLPEEKIQISLKGNKISRFNVERVPNGGVMGILKQIGVDVHQMA